MLSDGLDLLGDPIDPRRGLTGRPRHLPTAATRTRVAELKRDGRSQREIATAIGVTEPTLRLCYFLELGSASLAWRRRAEHDNQENDDGR